MEKLFVGLQKPYGRTQRSVSQTLFEGAVISQEGTDTGWNV